jgi:hypothetical protein
MILNHILYMLKYQMAFIQLDHNKKKFIVKRLKNILMQIKDNLILRVM